MKVDFVDQYNRMNFTRILILCYDGRLRAPQGTKRSEPRGCCLKAIWKIDGFNITYARSGDHHAKLHAVGFSVGFVIVEFGDDGPPAPRSAEIAEPVPFVGCSWPLSRVETRVQRTAFIASPGLHRITNSGGEEPGGHVATKVRNVSMAENHTLGREFLVFRMPR